MSLNTGPRRVLFRSDGETEETPLHLHLQRTPRSSSNVHYTTSASPLEEVISPGDEGMSSSSNVEMLAETARPTAAQALKEIKDGAIKQITKELLSELDGDKEWMYMSRSVVIQQRAKDK